MAHSRPPEQPAVRTTIVGGRPPGSGRSSEKAPRGIEVLIKKAAVDRTFKALLLKKRDAAAKAIGLALSRSEAAVLRSITSAQLAAMIRQTTVRPDLKPVFRGAAAALMLAALSAAGPTRAEEAPPRSDPTTEKPAPKEPEPRRRDRPAGEAELKPRMVCKVMPPRIVAIAGVAPAGWDQPQKEMVEFPPESTPELDKLTPEQVQERVKELLPKLANENFEVREQATLRLMQLGPRVLPLIAEFRSDDPEESSRLNRARHALEAAKKAEGQLQIRDGKWEWHVER